MQHCGWWPIAVTIRWAGSNQYGHGCASSTWQWRSRILGGAQHRTWIGGATTVVERGMSGATGNLYFGLHEFADMAFLLHFLRRDDLFFDIGANVGTYSILAAKLAGARVCSFEPDPETMIKLERNVSANAISNSVTLQPYALGEQTGEIGFTVGQDAMNHVTDDPSLIGQTVAIRRLDDVADSSVPRMIKIDVEGHEDAAFRGAANVLADPRLIAIEAETVSIEVRVRLESLGFTRCYYDPTTRRIDCQPNEIGANNQLFLRDIDAAQERVNGAVSIDLFGWKL